MLAPKVEVVLVQAAQEIPTVIMVQQDLAAVTPMALAEPMAAAPPIIAMAAQVGSLAAMPAQVQAVAAGQSMAVVEGVLLGAMQWAELAELGVKV